MFENVTRQTPATPTPAGGSQDQQPEKDWGPWKPVGQSRRAGPPPPPPLGQNVPTPPSAAATPPPPPTAKNAVPPPTLPGGNFSAPPPPPGSMFVPGAPGGESQPPRRKFLVIGIVIFLAIIVLVGGAFVTLNYFNNQNENANTSNTNFNNNVGNINYSNGNTNDRGDSFSLSSYTDPKGKFKIQYPSGWDAHSNENSLGSSSGVTFTPTDQAKADNQQLAGLSIIISLDTRDTSVTTPQAWAADAADSLKNIMEEKVTIDGNSTLLWNAQIKEAAEPVNTVYSVILYDNTQVELTSLIPEEISETYTPLVKKVITTFELLSDTATTNQNTNTTNANGNANGNLNGNRNINPVTNDVNSSQLDTDGDGLTDEREDLYSTDILNPDTDGDGYLDGEEVENGYNPNGTGRL